MRQLNRDEFDRIAKRLVITSTKFDDYIFIDTKIETHILEQKGSLDTTLQVLYNTNIPGAIWRVSYYSATGVIELCKFKALETIDEKPNLKVTKYGTVSVFQYNVIDINGYASITLVDELPMETWNTEVRINRKVEDSKDAKN